MFTVRTDLALEAREILSESSPGKIDGIAAEEREINGFPVTTVRVADENGAKAIGKPVETYVTLETEALERREDGAFERCALALAEVLRPFLDEKRDGCVLVAGLGNTAITPDALGPLAVKNIMVTRHLVESLPEHFSSLRRVAAVETGVLATTGVESAELVKAVSDRLRPAAVVVVDALASRRLRRVCTTVQVSDAGIIPGSGVNNSRAAIDRDTLGCPVIAVGVPTVVEAGTVAADLVSRAGAGDVEPEDLREFGGGMIVTPRDIDARVSDAAKLIGYGINLALHDGITPEDVTMFLS